ncbi:hypothetical protein K9L27_04055 [Candidatus Gracilibacteria bacterium]|nr:hypothetical protein [Candidatus Gracilibacteria bacterium]
MKTFLLLPFFSFLLFPTLVFGQEASVENQDVLPPSQVLSIKENTISPDRMDEYYTRRQKSFQQSRIQKKRLFPEYTGSAKARAREVLQYSKERKTLNQQSQKRLQTSTNANKYQQAFSKEEANQKKDFSQNAGRFSNYKSELRKQFFKEKKMQ